MLTLADFTGNEGALSAQFLLNDSPVTIRLAGPGKDVFAFFNFSHILALTEKAPRLIAAEMLDDKNGDWLKDGETPLDETSFARKLRLEELHIRPDKTIKLYYHDGDLFWGHTVVAEFGADGKMAFATIEG